ncbi:hypothetical protein C6W88_10135 [Halomonas litopenaei]|uniref:Uncharacterized protein n=1 Tax=Halomonas litopenaei TaxID=2109328 RepID=A0ABX5IYD7_9GAMM|nr:MULTISPECIES: hypothetical protein [Halomonas]MBS8271150.1 hypothetical protein [Halomonas litopenaei]PTL92259.1 hypothetical protein C6W89_06280 [Halomonas sp. SYSU XM8]PTL94720.1 hypothetical protein C6W88_10135 [Halomonas litopenaei]
MHWFGIAVTFCYSSIIVFLRWGDLYLLKTMPLNEVGDFLAGVFGPLMLFWLIVGYIQQQKEFRQNTEVLRLQADELKKSVEQHRQMVAVTREQVEAEIKALAIEESRMRRESQPSFSITQAYRKSISSGRKTFVIKVENNGRPASNVNFSSDPEIPQIANMGSIQYFKTGVEYPLTFDVGVKESPPLKLKVEINCSDENLQPYTKSFSLSLDGNERYLVSE